MEKTCSKCKQIKPLSEFARDKSGKNGLDYKCRACRKTAIDAWRSQHREHTRAYDKQWRKANPEKRKQQNKRYHASMSPQALANRLARRKRTALQNRLRSQRWRDANPDKVRVHRQMGKIQRRAREAAARFVEYVNLDVLYIRDRARCSLCGQHVKRPDASADHIIPLSKGGEHSYRNTALAHLHCNKRKKDGSPLQQMRLF